jgi:ABC-2 type transport system ATP-binding protein
MSTIAVEALTKRYGTVTAVSDLTFELAPGRITGFLGPNGAGKSTTIRLLLGLATPTSGRATINGRPYRELRDPLRHIGALTDPDVFHPGRSGRTALRIAARPARIPGQRVEEVLDLVGLGGAAHRRAGGYSQGMRQRLALAAALLGDPETLVLDEPANGLDPEGVHWLRGLLRGLADQGRTVFVSSHLLAELAQTVDDVVIIKQGRLVTAGPMAELLDRATATSLEGFFLDATSRDTTPRPPRLHPGKEPVMRSLVSAELLKLRSTRSAWIPPAAALAMAVVAVLASTTAAGPDGNPHLSPAALPGLLRGSGGQLVDGAMLLCWIVLSAGEFRHRTAVTTFLAEPNRLRIVSAKLITAALTGAAVGLLAEALSAATAATALSAHHVPLAWSQPGVPGTVLAVPLLAALYGMLGVGLGLLLRHTAAALGLALMWAFVIEGIIPAVTHQPGITRWLPEAAANAVLHGASAAATTLSAGAALAVLVGYAAALAGAGAALTARREIGTTD